jgi:peptidyl-prolyl cis-trans isomerase SurA
VTTLCLIGGLAVLAAGCRGTATTPGTAAPPASANTWATVNGHDITREEVEKAYRREAAGQQPSSEEALAGQLALVNEMIVQELLLAKAREMKIELSATEIDNAYAEAKQNITDEQFQKELASRNLTPQDMRDSLSRDMLANKVIEREVTSKIAVTEDDIKAFYEANKASFNRTEDAVHIAQIVITPTRENQQVNRSGNDAGTPQEAQAKAQMLFERLKAGAPFAQLAADFSEDPQSAQRGGDLGFIPISALRQAPPALRDAALNSQPGSVKLVSIDGGATIVAVLARDTAGQKDPSMPAVRDLITNQLKGRREQLLRTAYLNSLRNDATVVNHLADRIVEAQGKAIPSLAPASPAKK